METGKDVRIELLTKLALEAIEEVGRLLPQLTSRHEPSSVGTALAAVICSPTIMHVAIVEERIAGTTLLMPVHQLTGINTGLRMWWSIQRIGVRGLHEVS